jgi:hypothetical protein
MKSSNIAMWIAAPYAPEKSPFTVHTPRPTILGRIAAIARACTEMITAALISFTDSTWSALFHFSQEPFDAVFELNANKPALITHPDRCICIDSAANSVGGKVFRLSEISNNETERADFVRKLAEFDPAGRIVRSLRSALQDTAMVFADGFGPRHIAVVLMADRPTAQGVNTLLSTVRKVTADALLQVRPLPAKKVLSKRRELDTAQAAPVAKKPRKEPKRAQRG